ncbi:MAG: hypothetical protein KGH57_01400 [Candidatus Micrarchaeota archaeon]|nr:hypothetical protein [Candidatus Micrarchaeota archaeon]
MAGEDTEKRSAVVTKALSPKLEVLSSWETIQKKTNERLGKLENIFVETGLIWTRRGKRAWAEEAETIILQHQYDAFSLLRDRLTSEGMDKLLRRGDWLLESYGYSGPMNPMEVVAFGTTGATMRNLEMAVEKIDKSEGLSEEDKRLAIIAAQEIELGMAGEAANKHLRNYKLKAILHPVLRRSKAREEEAQIKTAIEKFDEVDS